MKDAAVWLFIVVTLAWGVYQFRDWCRRQDERYGLTSRSSGTTDRTEHGT